MEFKVYVDGDKVSFDWFFQSNSLHLYYDNQQV